MKPVHALVALLCLLALPSCTGPESAKYPLSGEECAPDDPVQDLDAVALPCPAGA